MVQGPRKLSKDWVVEEVVGHSSGICCLWDSSLWKVQMLGNSRYHVHLKVSWKSSNDWLLMVVYNSSHY